MAFTDSLDAATTENLEDHTPSGGGAWTRLDGVAGAAVVHDTDALRSLSTTRTAYVCTDQGSANQYVIHKCVYFGTGLPNSMVCNRLVDSNNGIGWRLAGTGSSGRRLSKVVSGTVTDLITSQGVSGEWIKTEISGTTAKMYEGGTGLTPGTWNQVGTDQTVSDFSTETSQGVLIASNTALNWIDDFEAGALGSGATTYTKTSAASGVLQKTQTQTVSASAVLNQLTARTKTAATNAALQKVFTQATAANAILSRIYTKTVAGNAVLEASPLAADWDSDAQAWDVDNLAWDAVASGVLANADAVLRKTLQTTSSASASLLKALSLATSSDAAIQQAQIRTAVANATIGSTFTRTATANAVLQKAAAVTASASAIRQATLAALATCNAILVVPGQQIRTTLIDAVLQQAAAVQATANAYIGGTNTKAATVSAILQKTSALTLAANATVFLEHPHAETFANAILQKNILTSAGADAIISTSGWVDNLTPAPANWATDGAVSGGWTHEDAISNSWETT